MSRQIIVYSTAGCSDCNLVKQMLTEQGVPFEVRDVMTSTAYQEEVERLGFMGVPVTVAGDHAVKGFDVPQLNALIEAAR